MQLLVTFLTSYILYIYFKLFSYFRLYFSKYTNQLNITFNVHYTFSPLQYSCLENPMDSQVRHDLVAKCAVASGVSDSLRPHGLQPARLLCPWDFPSKNIGVGFHFLSPGDLSNPGIKLMSFMFPALKLAGKFLICFVRRKHQHQYGI